MSVIPTRKLNNMTRSIGHDIYHMFFPMLPVVRFTVSCFSVKKISRFLSFGNYISDAQYLLNGKNAERGRRELCREKNTAFPAARHNETVNVLIYGPDNFIRGLYKEAEPERETDKLSIKGIIIHHHILQNCCWIYNSRGSGSSLFAQEAAPLQYRRRL